MNLIESLINTVARLPGLGRKSASRIVYYLLKSDRKYTDRLVREIGELKEKIKTCTVCGNYTQVIPCNFCTDPSREKQIICVVEQPKDVLSIEASCEYRGQYHVLMGVISPVNGIGPENLRITELVDRIKNTGIKEVVLATNPTVEGDTTALYLNNILKNENINISRLALGLPVGGDLEYADRLTLARAFKGRNPF